MSALIRHQIGTELRRIRHGKGLALAEVSALAFVSQSYLSELERGRKEASSEALRSICDALDVSLTVSLHLRNVQADG